jgi:tripartite ATP-independent transporter DctM subunit
VTVALLLFAAMLVLMALRVPVWLAMALPGLAGVAWLASPEALLAQLKGLTLARFTLYDLSVIPLFLLMGNLATQGGLSAALFRAAAGWVGHWRGGLAQAAVISCAAFGAICGSSVATAATVGRVALPEMRRYGYEASFATATLAAGGTLGILIPPSVVLVIYALVTEQNIARLFAAAFVPGLLAAALYCGAVALAVRLRPDLGPPEPSVPWAVRWRLLARVWPVAAIFALVLGGIYGGVFTATEGAAVGTLATALVGALRGALTRAGLAQALVATAETTGLVFLIFLGADILNVALALSQMPAQLAAWVGALDAPPLLVLVALLLFYVLLGGVMDEIAMLLLTLPVVFPAIMQLDLWGLAPEAKAIWFGILLLTVVNIGLVAPPVGLNVWVVSTLAPDVPMRRTYARATIFLAADALRLALLLAFPMLSLWLVQRMT